MVKAPRLFELEVTIPEELRPAVDLWLAYKRERGDKPYKPLGLAALVKKFAEWGPERAMAAVEHSMAADYAGPYEPTNGNGSKPRKTYDVVSDGGILPLHMRPGYHR